ncbi:nucleotide sugar dehydrogenase [Bradyrhizobium sp. U87765 SZCCT0131]|uniref:nucleotide sugar dehydrogenase n=1 Tax=unclassified Bradyrhizobium TaxID=2631580 RepID=UPI001BAE5030|nr:nucleotide sugar dehydrogenase [Bradyrhizobium sp. U87765 SZCCT0131]MBR1264334.1 nucleotide sugar dehydrogenase [Bradyrhizobium sp. U87765 SZCCT0134]MBR1304759.1 nucleotide sugar dehydrogenase [Bradyrhizobium sp. U87765 SZCCT0110]MBR1324095.1 nucleotide sugar dehydrogenase [Bradyrhizobium sp. U87765 SZCCT0109]MBR1346688.1 nucleotide sugar dehydrogenase [Bradyrhizobium sp. U87765 SZCCT0048]
MKAWLSDSDLIELAPGTMLEQGARLPKIKAQIPVNTAPRRISIFGLGYVGAVSAACFAKVGHTVIGLDVNDIKRQCFREGKPPVVEPGLGEMMQELVQIGRLTAVDDVQQAIDDTDVSLICVGTPSRDNGSINIDIVCGVVAEIGRAIRNKKGSHLVVVRSTMIPGTMRNTIIPILERESGRRCGEGLSVAYNPEFLRESTAVSDFFSPPKTVIGTDEPAAGDQVAGLYEGIVAPVFTVAFETSEMIKYADNTWHALKVCFGNEIGNICQALNIDSHELMDVFCSDTKLNISPTYLKPGFAFGGSCLPKDSRALTYLARQLDVEAPILSNILPSNRIQIERAISKVIGFGHRNIAVLGFSFKPGTDDLRESPQVELIERLIGKGYNLKLYDASVNLSALTGVNRRHIEQAIPHIGSIMMSSMRETVESAEVIIIGNASPEFRNIEALIREDQIVLDLARLWDTPKLGARYVGINW